MPVEIAADLYPIVCNDGGCAYLYDWVVAIVNDLYLVVDLCFL